MSSLLSSPFYFILKYFLGRWISREVLCLCILVSLVEQARNSDAADILSSGCSFCVGLLCISMNIRLDVCFTILSPCGTDAIQL